MAALNLTSTSKSITAEVTDLQEESVVVRRFKWYLDGTLKFTEAVNPPLASRSYTFAPVYFASTHTVKVEIYDNETEELYYTDEDSISTLYPTITPWSWSTSNGEATAQQTQAAKTALDTVGQVSDFHYKVWDDFIRKIAEAREETGQVWLNTYATEAAALVGAAYGQLTAARFNAAVQNIAYPYWTWERDPLAIGYLGRLLVRGTATQGANADTVYAAYLLELARKLNLVIGIYNNTGQLTPLASALNIALITAADLISLPPSALQTSHTINLIAEAQLIQLPPQALTAQLTAALTTSGLLISRPLATMSAGVDAQLTLFAQLASRPASVLPGASLSALISTAAKLEYVHMAFLSAAAVFTLSMSAFLGMNNQKTILYANLESSLSSAAEVIHRPPAELTANTQALLSTSLLIDIGSGHALQAGLQAGLTTSALLEMEAVVTWEYPVQTDDNLYITQVYSTSQIGNTVSLE